MSPRKNPAPNFYAGVPLDRVDQRRADSGYIETLINDPHCVIVPVWRAKHLIGEAAEAIWLQRTQAEHLVTLARESMFLGLRQEVAYLAVDLSHLEEPEIEPLAEAWGSFRDLRAVGPVMDRRDSAILAYARGLVHWHARHGFCGVCGSPTVSEKAGHQRRCTNPRCAAVHFPRTDPAVIMLIHDGGERCVLGRQTIWPPGMHSTLAGFVEPGESLEEAVAREIYEEVGLKIPVEEVFYHSSQPWPFPSSIMLGFYARAEFAALETAEDELESAEWFTRDQLRRSPEDETFRLPRRDSIARRLVNDWLAEG